MKPCVSVSDVPRSDFHGQPPARQFQRRYAAPPIVRFLPQASRRTVRFWASFGLAQSQRVVSEFKVPESRQPSKRPFSLQHEEHPPSAGVRNDRRKLESLPWTPECGQVTSAGVPKWVIETATARLALPVAQEKRTRSQRHKPRVKPKFSTAHPHPGRMGGATRSAIVSQEGARPAPRAIIPLDVAGPSLRLVQSVTMPGIIGLGPWRPQSATRSCGLAGRTIRATAGRLLEVIRFISVPLQLAVERSRVGARSHHMRNLSMGPQPATDRTSSGMPLLI